MTEEEQYNPYCPVCDGCGEEGCCPPTNCSQSPEGHYCKSYLQDLKFGYMMYKWVMENMEFSDQDLYKYEEEFDKVYDIVYKREEDAK